MKAKIALVIVAMLAQIVALAWTSAKLTEERAEVDRLSEIQAQQGQTLLRCVIAVNACAHDLQECTERRL